VILLMIMGKTKSIQQHQVTILQSNPLLIELEQH
jgi:hypothetical protein